MFKPILTQVSEHSKYAGSNVQLYIYTIQYDANGQEYVIILSEISATKLQQYIDSVHPSEVSSQQIVDETSIALDVYSTGSNMDTQRGDYQPPVPGDEDNRLPMDSLYIPVADDGPNDRANGDHHEVGDDVCY